MTTERLDELINGWLDDISTDAEHAELETQLLNDAAARARFWQSATFHGMTAEAAHLRWGVPSQSILAAGDADSPPRSSSNGQPNSSPVILPLSARLSAWLSEQSSSPRTVSIVVLVGLATYFSALLLSIVWQLAWKKDLPVVSRSPHLAGVERSQTVAILIRADQCQWEESSIRLATGDPLGPGRLHLLAGTADIEFQAGARVRIHGPTSFELESDSLGFLEEGRLSARVPPRARGFTIDTPTVRVIDLGTAFVVEVNQAAETRMAVTEGTVQVLPVVSAAHEPRNYTDPSHAQRLTLGQAMAIAPSDAGPIVAATVPFDAGWVSRHAPPGELLQMSPAGDSRDTFYESMIHTSDLVGYWRLGEMGGQLARDEIGVNANPGGFAPGIYRNVQAVSFRQPGALKSKTAAALHFDGASYVEIEDRRRRLTGDWNGFTIAAWISPADLSSSEPRMIAATWTQMVSQDQYALWQNADKIGLAVADGRQAETGAYSAGKVPLVAGQWSFVAGTWDKATRAMHLYVNGQDDTPENARQAGSGINQNSTASFCIGSQSGKNRFFVGLIEEVAVFQRCLPPREIAALYAAGALPANAGSLPVGKEQK